MADNTPTITTLHQLLDEDARKFTSAEIELINNLPQWIRQADSIQLKSVLKKYFDFLQEHVKKMESFIEAEKITALNVSNRVMLAFIAEINEKWSNCTDPEIKDACLLSGIQAINHFKISMYGTAAAFAKTLDMENQAALFKEAELNEKQIDDTLSQLAVYEINNRAKNPVLLKS